MTNQDDVDAYKSPPVPSAPPADVESQPSAPPAHDVEIKADPATSGHAGSGFGVTEILKRWKRNDMLKRGGVVLRGASLVLSLLAAIIMGSNKHGDWKEFDKYEEYRYLLAIEILAVLYSGVQVLRHIAGKEMFQSRTAALVDFIGDQIMAYLLLSSASAAIPLTNKMRESQDNIFTDASAAAISMAIFAFFTHALLSLISGHKLSSQSYI